MALLLALSMMVWREADVLLEPPEPACLRT